MEIELIESPTDMLDVSPKTETGLTVQAAREVVAAAPSVPSGPMANAIAFLQAGGTMETLERMMAMQKEHNAALAEQAYNASFAAFKAEAVRIVKAKEVTAGPLSGKSYAELFNVVDAVTPALSKHGLSASWKITKDEPQWLEVTCTLKHIDGHSESVSMGGPPDSGGAKNKIQERASTVSYLQRYTLKAVCGVAEGGQDDDGNGGDENRVNWAEKAKGAQNAKALQDIRREGTAALQKAKDREGYAAFAHSVKTRAAELEAANA
jgi:hypothetical protein